MNPPDKALVLCVDEKSQIQALVRIPVMSISRSELMSIRTERSDAGHSQCETVIDIRQRFSPFSAPGGGNALPPSAYVFGR
jgi:hypothetical protein